MDAGLSRIELAQLPTPLERADQLRQAWGGPELWIKRDDLTGFGLSGNKVRKLEFVLAAAIGAGATTVVTCGAVQSNHCRATALAAARLGLGCVLLLRSPDGEAPDQIVGNHLLARLAGAEVRFITPARFVDRAAEMQAVVAELAAGGVKAWAIPAGASDAFGVAAFDHAVTEVAGQVADQIGVVDPPITIWHASSSGGTTAGLALGASRVDQPFAIVGSSVGEAAAELTATVRGLLADTTNPSADFDIIDDYVGLGYGRTTADELAAQVEATRLTGQIWDPTYTGKALFALRQEIAAGRFNSEDRVIFWHTGGGFAAFAHDFDV